MTTDLAVRNLVGIGDPSASGVAANVVLSGGQYALVTTSAGGGSTGTGGTTAPTSANEVGGVYNSSAPTFASGQLAPLQTDSQGDLYVNLASLLYGEDATNSVIGTVLKPIIGTTYSRLPVNLSTSAAYTTVKGSAGQLFAAFAYNVGTTIAYAQVFNVASGAPSGAPLFYAPVPAGTANNPGTVTLDAGFFGENGINFSTGITIALSSTAATYTAVGTPGNFGGGATYF